MRFSLAAISIAFFLSLVLGLILGKASSHSPLIAAIGHYLTEARLALLPIFLLAVLVHKFSWPHFLLIGIVVGVFQALATNRWITKRNEDWNPALLSRVTLGRSATSLFAQRARSRGAVVATLATTSLQVVILEVLIETLYIGNTKNLGHLIVHGTLFEALGAVSAMTLLMLSLELVSASILQRKRPS